MNRINQILKSGLFTNPNYKTLLRRVYNAKIEIPKNEENVYQKWTHRIFNDQGDFNNELYENIGFINDYINLGLDSFDRQVHKFFFLALLFSIKSFPDEQVWETFLNESEEVKRICVKNGIKSTWLELQSKQFEINLNNSIDEILNSNLLSDPRIKYLMQESLPSTIHLPLNRIFSTQGVYIPDLFDERWNFKKRIHYGITLSIVYINLEFNVNNVFLQKYIFLTFLYATKEFPEQKEWEIFLNQNNDTKRVKLIDGIITIWSDLQNRLIESLINQDSFPF